MQGPGSVAHAMGRNGGVLPDDVTLMHDSQTSGCSASSPGAAVCTNGKVSRSGWFGQKQPCSSLSAGSWGIQPSPAWQLSTTSLSVVVLASIALGAGGAWLVNRRL